VSDDLISTAAIVDKPWGNEVIFALVEGRFCGKILNVRDGESLSLQYHRTKEEVIFLYEGAVALQIGGSEETLEHVSMKPGMAVHLRPGTLHRITGEADSVLLEVSSTELDDVVRLEDLYGREGTSAP
jgi:mannose-6-phosphate isomerase